MASNPLPVFVDPIKVGDAIYVRNSCGLHVPVESMDAEEQLLAPRWRELIEPTTSG